MCLKQLSILKSFLLSVLLLVKQLLVFSELFLCRCCTQNLALFSIQNFGINYIFIICGHVALWATRPPFESKVCHLDCIHWQALLRGGGQGWVYEFSFLKIMCLWPSLGDRESEYIGVWGFLHDWPTYCVIQKNKSSLCDLSEFLKYDQLRSYVSMCITVYSTVEAVCVKLDRLKFLSTHWPCCPAQVVLLSLFLRYARFLLEQIK